MKLTKEDIEKYGTEEEKESLKDFYDGRHKYLSVCCGARVIDAGGVGICSECREWCDISCEKCEQEWGDFHNAANTPCEP